MTKKPSARAVGLAIGVLLALMSRLMIGCSSQSLTPDMNDVKAGHNQPSSDCVQVSKVTGTTMTAKGTPDEALADMKKDAANRGANYVKIDEYSAYGTAVTGVAYKCP